MDPSVRRASNPLAQKEGSNITCPRRRPYSNTSSIRSIIHGPNIEDIEEELKKLEMEEECLMRSQRSTPVCAQDAFLKPPAAEDANSNIVSRRSSASIHPDAVERGFDPYRSPGVEERYTPMSHKRRIQSRPKTCAANFPMRSPDSISEARGSLPRRLSDMNLLKKIRLPQMRNSGCQTAPIRERRDETLSERHEWGIRREPAQRFYPQTLNPEDVEKMAKRRIRARISASAPPGKMSQRLSFAQDQLVEARSQSARAVEAFTPSSRMNNTVVIGPKRLRVFQPRPSPPTTFRRMYERGDIPVTLQHDYRGQSLRWKVELDKLDLAQYLPLFFDGLRETRHPYDFFSRAGVRDLLTHAGDRLLPLIPQLILPMKSALNTRIPGVVCTVLKVLQEVVTAAEGAGEALVPYYRQLLPTLNLFQHKNVNCGDEIDYTQQRRENLGDLIQETLELLERHGGKDAYINIKYMVPTYQSCINA